MRRAPDAGGEGAALSIRQGEARPAAPVRGLVLAGGGARGSYQVGVWQALQELGWAPGVIAGTSVGCLNGAMFALGLTEVARDMWLTINSHDVMALPGDRGEDPSRAIFRQLVEQGGLDVTPLEGIVDRVLDEAALRASPIRFGLVTVELRGLKPRQLTLEEIPEGQLAQYLLASAACFPAFRPRTIDGVEFIDGGYNDNMPIGLAARMGATELVAVDVDGVGVTRKNRSGLPTTLIHSFWELGSILQFEPATARRNIALGYLDAYRAFGRLRGAAYGVRVDDGADGGAERAFAAPYAEVMGSVLRRWPALALTEGLALNRLGPEADRALAPLELAALTAGVDPTRAYTLAQLEQAFLDAWDPAPARRLWPLFSEEGGGAAESALAALQPAEFVTAAVWRVLQGPEFPD